MNKAFYNEFMIGQTRVVLLGTCLLLFPAMAKTAQLPQARSTLYITDSQGSKKSYMIEIQNHRVKVNGCTLRPEEVLLKQRPLAAAFTISSRPSPLICTTGIFIHEIKKGNGPAKIEEGCLTDQRFELLYASHSYLNKYF